MRLRTPASLLASILMIVGLAATPAAQASTSAGARVDGEVAGNGPGCFVRATGTGFTPSVAVAVTLDTTTSSVPLASTTADAAGNVSLPADTRIPLSTAPGEYRITMTQPDGVVGAQSLTIFKPQVRFPAVTTPGQPASTLYTKTAIFPLGLATTPDVVRTVTLDGAVVGSSWSSTSFGPTAVGYAVPPDLPVGKHTLTFTQTGSTPFTATGTVNVDPPWVKVLEGPFFPRSIIGLRITAGWTDDFDVTVVGAAGDRRTGHAEGTGYGDQASGSVALQGLSAGTATVTVVSRHNGGTGSTTFVVDGESVSAPQGLAPGRRLVSADGGTQLLMQSDGNLVYGTVGQHPVWSTRTAGHPGAHLAVQSDGNVVLYDVNGRVLWHTATAGIGPGARLGLIAGGDFGVYAASGRQAYCSFVAGVPIPVTFSANDYLFKREVIGQNVSGGAPDTVQLEMQTDGNVVVSTRERGVRWSTRTAGHPNAYLVLQSDGNLVLHAVNGTVLWANYAKATGARLVAQSDGNIVEYASNGRAVWSTRTSVR